MYKLNTGINKTEIRFSDELVLSATTPMLDLNELKKYFNHVPYDIYFKPRSRYRTTSRIRRTNDGLELMPKVPLYQPSYVNKLDSYGGIDRHYEDVPEDMIKTEAFSVMIEDWIAAIPFEVNSFSVHQIRTVDCGNPTPEGAHRDGTDWTGVYIVNRSNIKNTSGKTVYWNNQGEKMIDHVFPEGTLISHFDRYFTHLATPIEKLNENNPSFRDVFVLTTPEHGVNREQEEERKSKFSAEV
jgi:hypothetical protein